MAEVKHMYEFPYVVDGVLSEEKIKEVVQRVTQFITENGGEIIQVDEWGMRRLAYPIRKKNNGYYVITYFNAPGDLIGRLERAMQINDNILRYLTLRYDAKMRRQFEKQRAEEPAAFNGEEEAKVEA